MDFHRSRAAISVVSLLLLWIVLVPGVRADFSFVHITDTHFTTSTAKDGTPALNGSLFDEIRQLGPKPAFVIHTGDVCEVGTPDEYAAYRAALPRLGMPIYVAPGNHDTRWNSQGKRGYQQGTGQPLYQSWDFENVHFVLLDSTLTLQHWGHFDHAQLDWLASDLKKIGREKPVIIGFHHFFYRPGEAQIDNREDLWKVLAPYNIRLFLIGHGHSDLNWSINGVPAIMAKGLYQGSYHLIRVTKDRLTIYRRTTENTTLITPLLSTSLAPTPQPQREVKVTVSGNIGTVRLTQQNLPTNAVCSFRVNSSTDIPMQPSHGGFEGKCQFLSASPGYHNITVTAILPDNRAYQTAISLKLDSPEAIKPLWKVDVGGEVQSKLVLKGETLYVPTMSGDLVALNAKTGKELWRCKTGGVIFSVPLVAQGMVIFGSGDGAVYAVDAETGKLRWRLPTGGPVFAGAALAGNVVCIPSADRKIYGLDSQTGHPLWTVASEGLYQSQVVSDGEHFFLGGWDNAFRCLDARTGNESWTQKFGRNSKGDLSFYYSPAIGSPTIGGDKVFVTSNDGYLHAIAIASGNVLWEVNGPSLGYSGPLFHEGKIYNASLTEQGRVFCMDAGDGHKIWEQSTGGVIYDSSCAIGQGAIFVGCVNGTFSALQAKDGKILWQYQLQRGHVLASPAADDSRVYIGTLKGEVVCFPIRP